MPPFQQALSHLLDVLSQADAAKIGGASQESLARLITLTRKQPTAAPAAPAPSQKLSPPSRPARTEAPVEAEPTTAPRRKLGLADQLRAAMASGSVPDIPPPYSPRTPPSPPAKTEKTAETPAAAAPSPNIGKHLPPEAQLEQLNATIMAAAPSGTGTPHAAVLGQGSARAELVFIGASPDPQQRTAPIAGEVGALLDKIIATMRVPKGDIYITNILKEPSASGGLPSPAEIDAHLPHLLAELEIIRPKCIVALGETALAALVGKREPIDELRGQWHSFRGIPVMATFHPAYLCENESKQVRRMFWEDMLQVLELLARPITPRQREFFK